MARTRKILTSESTPKSRRQTLPTIFMEENRATDMVYHEVQRWLEMDRGYPFERLQSVSALTKRSDLPEKGLVVVHVASRDDLLRLENTVSRISDRESLWNLQFIVVCRLEDPNAWRYLRERNFVGISPSLMSLRAIKLRIDRHLRLLELSLCREPSEFIRGLQSKVGQMPTFRLKWAASLFVENDIWLVPTERFIYRASEKWVLNFWGPSEKAGSWQEVPPKEKLISKSESGAEGSDKTRSRIGMSTTLGRATQDKWWRWVPKTPFKKLVQGKVPGEAPTPRGLESWFFKGSKPKCQEGRWIFVGLAPELLYIDSARIQHPKFRAHSADVIEIATNSSRTVSFLEAETKGELKKNQSPASIIPDFDISGFQENGKNVFQPIEDLDTIHEILGEGARKKAVVTLWLKKEKLQLRGRIQQVEGEALKVIFTPDKPEAFAAFLSACRNSAKAEVLGSFKTARGAIFAMVEHYDPYPAGLGWTLTLKRIVFQVQRRNHVRTPVVASMRLRFELGGALASPINISEGGVCGALLNTEATVLKRLQILPYRLWIGDRLIQGTAEVRWTTFVAQPVESSVKILAVQGRLYFGLRFYSLSVEEKMFLSIFVFEYFDQDSV